MSATYWQRINANGWAPDDLFSWKKKQRLHNEYYGSLILRYPTIGSNNLLCWPLILLHHVQNGFSLICPHVFPISAGFQLTLFLGVRRAGPLIPPSVSRPVPGSSGSRQLPISLSGTIKVSTLRGHQYVRTRDEVLWGKEMLSLYFRLAVFCLSEARVPEIDM